MISPRARALVARALAAALVLQSGQAAAAGVSRAAASQGSSSALPALGVGASAAAPSLASPLALDASIPALGAPLPALESIPALAGADATATALPASAEAASESQPFFASARALAARSLAPVSADAALGAPAFAGALAREASAPKQRGEFGLDARDAVGAPALSRNVWDHAKARGFAMEEHLFEPVGAAPGASTPGLKPAADVGAEPSAEPAPPARAPDAKARAFRGFLASLISAQLWVEGSVLVAPQLAKALSDSFLAMSGISFLSFIGLVGGSLVGPAIVQRYGIRATYVGAMVGRTLAGAGLAYLFVTATLNLPVLMGLFAAEYVLLGISRVAEATLPTALYGSAELPVNRFGIWKQAVIEGIGIGGPLLAGAMILTGGFAPLLVGLPILMAIGTVVALATIRVPGDSGAVRSTAGDGSMRAAAKAIWSSTDLRWAVTALTVAATMISSLYLMIVPAFGIFVGGTAEAATQLAAWLTGIFASGGFAATLVSGWVNGRSERAAKALDRARAEEAGRQAFQRNTRAWAWIAVGALLSVGAMTGVLGIAPIYALMFFLGFAMTGILVPLETVVRSRAPQGQKSSVPGLATAIVQMVTTAAFLGQGVIFEFFSHETPVGKTPTATAFGVIALAAAAGAAVLIRFARSLGARRQGFHYAASDSRHLRGLSRDLAEEGYPKLVRERVADEVSKDRPTVAVLSSGGADALALLEEGARQSPGDVLLVLDPSWLVRETGTDGVQRLYLNRGVHIREDGTPVFTTYKHPRLLRHVVDAREPGSAEAKIAVEADGTPIESAPAAPRVPRAAAWTLAALLAAVPAGASVQSLPRWEISVSAAQAPWDQPAAGAITARLDGRPASFHDFTEFLRQRMSATPEELERLRGDLEAQAAERLARAGTQAATVRFELTQGLELRHAGTDGPAAGLAERRRLDPASRPAGPWMGRILRDARRAALRGKRLLVVWSGFPEKTTIFETMKELGVEVVLVDNTGFISPEFYKDVIQLPAGLGDGHYEKVLAGIRGWQSRNGGFDGIVTFWEDSTPLTARLGEALGLRYHPLAAAQAARSKGETRKAMEGAGLPTPQNALIKDEAGLEAALAKGFPFPAVLKPAFGIEGMSIVRVNDADEARRVYRRLREEISPATNDIFLQGTDVLMEQYLDGQEFDMDMLLQNGKVVFHSETDNWPTAEPYFIAAGASLPSRAVLIKDGRAVDMPAEMHKLAHETALAEGFRDGILHVEGKYTTHGPRILEVNARMGGLWVRNWVREVTGVDMVEQQLLVSAGVPVGPYKSPKPLKHLEGEFFIPARSGTFEGFVGVEEARLMPGFHRLIPFHAPGEKVLVPPDGYMRAGMISAEGRTAAEALGNFNAIRPMIHPKIHPATPFLSLNEA
ncbi:MAG TPA: ATP-grasp domain-containing protein, partial [Elusimicrobiota bacterium]|nr:ATP-grasp domain-containing protein [Elusimicrobiota bacterium]